MITSIKNDDCTTTMQDLSNLLQAKPEFMPSIQSLITTQKGNSSAACSTFLEEIRALYHLIGEEHLDTSQGYNVFKREACLESDLETIKGIVVDREFQRALLLHDLLDINPLYNPLSVLCIYMFLVNVLERATTLPKFTRSSLKNPQRFKTHSPKTSVTVSRRNQTLQISTRLYQQQLIYPKNHVIARIYACFGLFQQR